MFTIDLLKGAGAPPRSHPARAAAATLAFMAVIVGVTLDGLHYVRNRDVLTYQRRALAYYSAEIAKLGDVAETLDAAQKRREQINATLTEVNMAMASHATWSPILLSLSHSASKDVLVTEVTAKREEQGPVDRVRYTYTLAIGVVSPSGPATVERFVRSLRAELPLQSGPDSIRIVSQHQEQTLGGPPRQCYVIECRLDGRRAS